MTNMTFPEIMKSRGAKTRRRCTKSNSFFGKYSCLTSVDFDHLLYFLSLIPLACSSNVYSSDPKLHPGSTPTLSVCVWHSPPPVSFLLPGDP